MGNTHTVGLKTDGTVVAGQYVGNILVDDRGECKVNEWTDIIAISATDNYTMGLKADGTVVATEYLGEAVYYQGQCEVSKWKDIKIPQK